MHLTTLMHLYFVNYLERCDKFMKVKVYIMHSDKINYKENLYKPLLEFGLMKQFNLILPMSEKYINTYIKDLLNEIDIIICDLTNCNFLLKTEIKMANKLNKKIYYIINLNDKKVNKYKIENLYKYNNIEEMLNIVNNILNGINQKEILLNRDNIYSLGRVTKTKEI